MTVLATAVLAQLAEYGTGLASGHLPPPTGVLGMVAEYGSAPASGHISPDAGSDIWDMLAEYGATIGPLQGQGGLFQSRVI